MGLFDRFRKKPKNDMNEDKQTKSILSYVRIVEIPDNMVVKMVGEPRKMSTSREELTEIRKSPVEQPISTDEDLGMITNIVDDLYDILKNIQKTELPEGTVMQMTGPPRKYHLSEPEMIGIRNLVSEQSLKEIQTSRAVRHASEFASLDEKEYKKWAANIASDISQLNPDISSLDAYDRVLEFVDICNFVATSKGSAFDYREIVSANNAALQEFCTMSVEDRENLKRQYGYNPELKTQGK